MNEDTKNRMITVFMGGVLFFFGIIMALDRFFNGPKIMYSAALNFLMVGIGAFLLWFSYWDMTTERERDSRN